MFVEANFPDAPWQDVPDLARRIEALGFDGIAEPELRRDPFLPLTLAATATKRVRLATSVAIAFPRSPTVVAYTARNLQDLAQGRFVLGLGTQVKGHIERRFGTQWDSPGPRLRDYILALRAIWDTWQHGTPLNFQGRFYALSLMTPEFDPGPSPFPPIKVQIAAVNPYNLQLAGELCDGLRVHPLTTPAYLQEVIWPNVVSGARKAGRDLRDFELVGGGFIATGATEAEVHAAREQARYRIAFYASTRTYLPVLEHHGWADLNPKLRRLIAQDRWDDLPSVVPDDVLDAFCVSGTYDTIVPAIRKHLGGLVDGLSFPLPADQQRPDDRYLDTLAQLKQVPPAAGNPSGH